VSMRIVLLVLLGCATFATAFQAAFPTSARTRCAVRLVGADDRTLERSLQRRLFQDAARGQRPLETAYVFATGALAMRGFMLPSTPATQWLVASTAVAVLFDFGPSARRDLATSESATSAAVEEYIEVSPPVVLVDNFVRADPTAEPPDTVAEQRKEVASSKLAASHRWALLVRCRIAADALSVTLILLSGRACLGAALLLGAHATYWVAGAAAARLDSCANPQPLSPALVKLIIGPATFGLAAAALLGELGWNPTVRTAATWAFARAMLVIQSARLIADRVRARVHVGL